MLLFILTLLQLAANVAAVAQLANYILLFINGVYTIFMTVFIVPTYKEHKLLVEEYKSRTSPIALDAIKKLEIKEVEEFKEVIEEIKTMKATLADIKHDVNGLKQDKVNLTVISDCINDLSDAVDKLNKNINK